VETSERIEEDWMPQKNTDGRDELNLAEFPLCAVAHRLRPGQKTIQFEDRVWDERRSETIRRQLTVTGSDAYGLPTALDDEVLLGLIQLTRLRGFTDRKVPFTRYQLIQALGWRDDSKCYERLETSLNRWTGVTLYYQNAWWSKARQCWVNEKFHVLDNVWLCHRSDPHPGTADGEAGAPQSAFVWNEVIFRSFQAGNLKSIDFDFFKGLDSAVAKRLYRFLDKRFFHKRQWEFNLKELAWEHVGLARSYDSASLKRKMRPGITELEARGYLEPMADAERFRKICSGEWRVLFSKAASPSATAEILSDAPEAEALAAALVERGVTPSAAGETVRQFPEEQITRQIEVFDWLLARRDPKVSRNPPGFLISAIKGEYAPPREYIGREEQARRKQKEADHRRRMEVARQTRAARKEAQELERERGVQQFWQSLPEEEKLRVEDAALACAPPLQKKLLARGGSVGAAARRAVLDAHVLRLLQTERQGNSDADQ
jgi:hypothetical protein